MTGDVWRAAGLVIVACCVTACGAQKPAKTGNVIFLHIDGAGIAHWQMARMLIAGPDGEINWDIIPHIAVYRGHQEDTLTTSSNAAATTHAYGVKVPYAAFGTDGHSDQRPVAPSGKRRSIMEEAKARGLAVGVVNSGSPVEPGTACFLTAVHKRDDSAEIVAQQLASGADVILMAGEEWYLPEGVKGRHGSGKRTDGRNLVEEAKASGYKVVFTRKELASLPDDAGKVLGIFAAQDTFNDEPEEELAKKGLPPYDPSAPTIAE
ncbi:MAG: alkaline phosphatase, partial [Chthoniobacterales bacterium]